MSDSDKAPIVVAGAGYVGLVTAAGLAQAREVRLVDPQERLIEDLRAGRTPISEPNLDQRLARHREMGRIAFFTNLQEALADGKPQLVFVAVGTPTRAGKCGGGDEADLSAIKEVIADLIGHTKVAVVMKSTVPPGTGRVTIEQIREQGSDLNYISCPEFLREGSALADFDHPDRIVVGREAPSWASAELRRLHAEVHPWVDTDRSERYLEMDTTSAELVKSASNLHLAMRISYANQIASIAEELGADVTRVLAAVGADRRIGRHFLEPGVGFGGSCFEKDVRALRHAAQRRGIPLRLADAALQANEEQALRVVLKLEDRLGSLERAHIALLGLAFKRDTDDVRNSPAFAIARELRMRKATLRAWDPLPGARERAVEPRFAGVPAGEPEEPLNGNGPEPPQRLLPEEIASSAIDSLDRADAAVLVTDWPQFAQIDWREAANSMRGTLIIDGRNMLSAAKVRAAGLKYEGTGRESIGIGSGRKVC